MGDHASEVEALENILTDASAEPIMLSYTLLKKITNNFSQVIGSGGFGVVYMGVLKNGKVAVKKLSRTDDISDKQFEDEVTCLIRVKHKNIVRFLGYCSDTQRQVVQFNGQYVLAEVRQRLLCFEYVPHKSLQDYLKDESHGHEWNVRHQLIKGICQGLHYLHKEERISHLDLKPENILLDADMVPKITDFGLSRSLGVEQSRMFTKNICGSPGYIAPEYLVKGEISFKSDIFSLGIIIIKILRGSNDFPDMENWHKSLDVDGPQVQRCIEIAQICVDDDQHKRPTIDYITAELEAMVEKTSLDSDESRNDLSPSKDQIKSSSMELLEVDPGEISFAFELNKQISGSMKLTNKTDSYIAFNWKVTDPKNYSLTPNKGILLPRSTCCTTVLKQALKEAPPDLVCKDKFLLQSTRVTDGFTTNDIDTETFRKETGKVVNEVKLKAVLVLPNQQVASTIPEGNIHAISNPTESEKVNSDSTEFLQIEPRELSFLFESKKQISCSVELTNKTDSYVAYYWKLTNPKTYCIQPNKGVLLPRSICTIVIKKQALEAPPDVACKDKFLLLSTRVVEGFTINDINITETFSKGTGKVVNEVKLNAVLVLPD